MNFRFIGWVLLVVAIVAFSVVGMPKPGKLQLLIQGGQLTTTCPPMDDLPELPASMKRHVVNANGSQSDPPTWACAVVAK